MDEHDSLVGDPARRSPTRGRVYLRRLVGAGVAVGVLAGGAWAGASLVRDDEPPPSPTETAPPLARLRVIFPEGFTRAEMAERVGAVREIAIRRRNVTPRLTSTSYLRASATAKPPAAFRKDWGGRSLEGFLFPSTYEFSQFTSSARLVRDQLEHFAQQWSTVSLRYDRSKNLTPYDVLIIASMVEKETVAPEERRLVAAVIYNRLRAGMPLGIDATIRYGRDVPGTEPLRQSDLESDHPYNTRRRLGLPPTPIANPGLASIRAAANPARVDFLFFVRKPDGVHHFFTASESEFFAKKCEFGFGC
ncbi:MAG: endolytic transglycosylase MltG [Gaiellaceae bacterium]